MGTVRIFFLIWVQAYVLCPELTRSPLLFVHYHDHLAQDETLDPAQFLALHYADAGHKEDDSSSHEDLPFHHHGSTCEPASTKVWISDQPAVMCYPGSSGGHSAGRTGHASELPGYAPDRLQPPRNVA